MASGDHGGTSSWFTCLVWLVGTVAVVIGFSSLLSGFWTGSGLGSAVASILYAALGITTIIVTMIDYLWPREEWDIYINTFEGSGIATLFVGLSLLSIITIIDRTPTTLAGSDSSPEGLYAVPETVLFPVGIPSTVLAYTAVSSVILVVIGRIFAVRCAPMDSRARRYISSRILFLVLLVGSFFALLLLELGILGGVEIEGRRLLSTPTTGWVMLITMSVLLALPISIFTFPLLPDWIDEVRLEDRRRELLKDHIDANWRRARVLTTLVLTGAVGITLSFVFGRASPNFFFVLAIVGSVTIGPLGVVWFLMRRIREAEKKLQPSPP